ncbi:hypothetical protein ACFL6U_24195 [Planctomycetota bacterium]
MHQSKCLVCMTEESPETDGLTAVLKLAQVMHDRDIMIEFSGISDLTERDIATLGAIEVLLHETGHKLILRGIPETIKATRGTQGLTKTLHLQGACT